MTDFGISKLNRLGDCFCFVAGTPVLTAAGLVAIEAVEVGDTVIATESETGETAEKEVVEVYINQSSELIHLTVDGEEITTTPAHPFYVPEKGWTSAIDLRAGDVLVLVNGEYVTVEAVQHEILEFPVKVYNFQVADFHTYYVGEQYNPKTVRRFMSKSEYKEFKKMDLHIMQVILEEVSVRHLLVLKLRILIRLEKLQAH